MILTSVRRFGFFLFLVLIIGGCTVDGQRINTTNDVSTAYPGSTLSGSSSYPAPNNDPEKIVETYFPEKINVPEPKLGFGNAIGILLVEGSDQPYLGGLLLGEVLYSDSTEAPPLIQFSEETSIRALMDQTGLFLFTDVPPGEYGIIIWSPTGGTLLTDIKTGEMVKVTVIANKITDLGKIFIK